MSVLLARSVVNLILLGRVLLFYFIFLFFNFYFEIIIDTQEIARIIQRSVYPSSLQLPTMTISYMIIKQYQNHKIDIGIMQLRTLQVYPDFTYFYIHSFVVCVCMYVCSSMHFFKCIDSYNYDTIKIQKIPS